MTKNKIRVVGIGALSLAVACCAASAAAGLAFADEHVHDYVTGEDNVGVCSCGNLKIECESVTPNGTPTYGNESFIGIREQCSGGALIGNWGNGDNNVTYNFKATEGQKARIGLTIAACSASNNLIMKINGADITLASGSVMPVFNGSDYHNYVTVWSNTVTLKAENSYYLEAYAGNSFNFDYIIVDMVKHGCEHMCPECYKCLDETCTEEECKDKCQGHHHHTYSEGRCECGSALFEAETADLSECRPTAGNDTNIGHSDNASGGGLVGSFGVSGNKVIWRFNIDKAATAPLTLALSPCEGATTFSSSLSLTVNGAEVTWTDDNIRGLVGQQWHNYTDFTSAPFDFKAGNVTVVLQSKRAYNVNIDCLKIDFGADVVVADFVTPSHICEHVCPECGKCTDETCDNEFCADKCLGHHHHSFTEGRCECGAVLLEAETADVSECRPSGNNDTNIGHNDYSSGGGFVGNFGVAGNKVIWRFNINKAATAPLTLTLSPCEGATTFSSSLKLTVNGAEVTWTDDNIRGLVGQQWYNYSDFTTVPFEFGAGNVTIILEARRNYNVNIDCLKIGFGADVVVADFVPPSHICEHVCPECGKCTDETCDNEFCADKCLGHHHHSFTEGRCECGAVLLEAENTNYKDTITSTDSSGQNIILEESANASGGYAIGNWGLAGNKVIWCVEFDKDVTAPVSVYLASGIGGYTFGNQLKFTVGGTEIAFVDGNIANSGWGGFKAYETVPYEFKAGKTEIVLEMMVNNCYVNLDCIVVGITPDVNISMRDGVAPKVSDFTLVSNELTVGKEIEFSFTASDDVTSAENLAVTVKVYLNYDRDNQEELTVNNNKFTPAKEGRYTIVVTVADEEGNSATVTRALSVNAEEETVPPAIPEKPDDGDSNGGSVGAIIGVSVTLGVLAVVAIAVAVFLIIRKKKNY